jgi:hypothetical protein
MRIEELKRQGHSERSAADMMELEALKEYPEMRQEFNADRIRHRYRYHMKKKDMGETLPPKPVAGHQWPNCKKCGNFRVKNGKSVPDGEPDKNGKQTLVPAPASHGLCSRCHQEELREKELEKLQCDFDAKAKDFEQTPIDPKAECYWAKLTEQLEELLTVDFAIGKISPEMFNRVWNAFRILDDAIEQLSKLSKAPVFST